MGKTPVAVFTFFSRTTCGHCKVFKGETTDLKGNSKIDPNSGWEVLTSDKELQDLGVEFQLYQFGPEKDPQTGAVKNYALDEEYAARVKGIPRLEMSVPDDPHNFVEFGDPELRGWGAEQSVPIVKRWIIKHLKQEPFKSWRPKAKVARAPEVIMPQHKSIPVRAAAPAVPMAAPVVQQAPKPVFRHNPGQQALVAQTAKQPMVRPQYGQPAARVNRPAPIVVQQKVEEPEEVDSLQEEEPETDEENSQDEKSQEASDQEQQSSEEQEVKAVEVKQAAVQNRRPEMPAPQRRPVQRQPIVKSSRAPLAAPSAKPMPTQVVQAPSPRPVVQAAAPAPVAVQQSKPRFLPSNWDT